MAETAEENQNKGGDKPNGVDIWNAVILSITMLAVIYYAYITNQILTADTRPYVGVAIGFSSVYFPFAPESKAPIQAPISYINFGKQPADAKIWQVVVFSAHQIFEGPSFDGVRPLHEFIWPPPILNTETAESLEPLDSDTAKMILTSGDKGWLYVRVEVVYNGHHTDFCTQYRVIEGTTKDSPTGETKPALTDAQLCPDPTTNSAD
jgi:hypothetical protein